MDNLSIMTMDLIHAIESGKTMLAYRLSVDIKEELEKQLKEKIKVAKNGIITP